MAQYTKLSFKEIIEILRRFELNALDYDFFEGGAANSSYLVRTEKMSYVLTIFEINLFRVLNLSKLLRLLGDYDFPTSRVQLLKNSDAITICQGKPALLKRHISGQVTKDIDDMMFGQVGEAMAKLHKIPPPDYLPDKHPYGMETFPPLMESGHVVEYELWLSKKYYKLTRAIASDLPRGLIHGDLFYDNVVFEGGSFKAIIDFEESCHYYKIFDLGMAVVGMCTEGHKVKLPKVQSLISGYQKIRKLEDPEKKALQLFIEYAAIATSSWRYWKYNIDTSNPEKMNKHNEMVRIANNVCDIPGSLFMDAVFV